MAAKTFAEIFSCNIQRRRKLLGMTQDELAGELFIGQQSLSRIERGTMAPKFERLPDIARALRCSVAELFVDDEEIPNNTGAIIAEILRDLTPDEQNSVLRFVADAALIFKRNRG